MYVTLLQYIYNTNCASSTRLDATTGIYGLSLARVTGCVCVCFLVALSELRANCYLRLVVWDLFGGTASIWLTNWYNKRFFNPCLFSLRYIHVQVVSEILETRVLLQSWGPDL